MKTITWHYGGLVQAGSHDLKTRRGGAARFRVNKRYKPVEVRLSLASAPKADSLIIDINDDGVSLFDVRPSLVNGQDYRRWTTFSETGPTRIEDGSFLTLDIDETAAGAAALTVELDLVEV